MKKLLQWSMILGLVAVFSLAITISTQAKSTTIKVWAMGDEAKKIDAMVEIFEAKYPEIQVEVQALPWSSAHDKLITGIAGSMVPDVAQMGTTWMAEFGSIGVFEDLSKWLKKSELISQDDFFNGSFETNIVDGKIYGLPWYVDTRVLYYRTDLFAEKGYNHPPRNWEELVDIAGKLTADGDYGLALSTNNYQEFLPFVWQNGGRVLNDEGKPAVTEPEFIEALEFYVNFFKQEMAPVDAQGTDLFQEFGAGRMPMYFSGPWMIRLTEEQVPEITGKWSVAVMPQKKSQTSFVGGSNLVIFKQSKNKEAAWKFVEFMSQAESQLEWFKVSGSLPSNRHSWEDSYFNNMPMLKVFPVQLEDAKAPVNIPQWPQIEVAIQQRVQEACYGTKTPAEAAKALAKDIQRILR